MSHILDIPIDEDPQEVLGACWPHISKNPAHDHTYNSTTALHIGHVTLVNRKSNRELR